MTLRVFVSHASADRWVAEQLARRIRDDCGAETFIDVFDVAKGDDFEALIFGELRKCQELLVLLTPWSVDRNWVWVEIGAARALGLRIIPVLYQVSLDEIEHEGGGKTFLGGRNVVEINDADQYLIELAKRVKEMVNG
jgi:TIR domain-containing protein